ncbi:Amidohydrolase 2 [Rhodopirellula maiorica SM1]|uniref:Amidohydrolase 2 n=1 Tax=Rhodopirellula maiorica SM1 TaxID=1265738 RepID=M5RFE5_9BACT|nr:Amidohydrolase 2 [Rhodopirellula maiorica SM1]
MTAAQTWCRRKNIPITRTRKNFFINLRLFTSSRAPALPPIISAALSVFVALMSMSIADGQSPESIENTTSPAPSATPPAPSDAPLDGREGRELLLRNFRPRSQLRVPSHPRTHAAFPVVDVHTHFYYKLRGNSQAIDDFVKLMDRNQIAVCVSLDGKLGSQLDAHIKELWTDYRDRFVIYANIDWQGDGAADDPASWDCHRRGFAERTSEKLRDAVSKGVSGLKLFKRFGLGYKNPDGSLIKIDDPRWDPIWQTCGELGIPVIIHTADPAAFFDPIDETNERWEELSRHPNWSFHGDEFPSRDSLLADRNRVIARHPKTQFIGAHMANNAEDLASVAEWLDTYPNLWVEPASRINELGRQPYTSRDFMIRYADRILFGTDGPWPEARLRYYWRFFETRDENFPYSEKVPPPQGMWTIDGIDLPDDVLKKIYHENAAKLIPGVAERLAAFRRDPPATYPRPPATSKRKVSQ